VTLVLLVKDMDLEIAKLGYERVVQLGACWFRDENEGSRFECGK